jgi:hypothetical protein
MNPSFFSILSIGPKNICPNQSIHQKKKKKWLKVISITGGKLIVMPGRKWNLITQDECILFI